MDLGCLDLGCVSVSDKAATEPTLAGLDTREDGASESGSETSKNGKNKSPKETGNTTWNSLSKFTSQIKKSSHRKSSPLNWFPRKKVDSYLKRKIKMLQEVDGMNLTLDETLGDSNPHYSRVLREKMAAREAAHKAMEARKAALVEASWCRILQAARIQRKEAETQALEAERAAAQAFEAATVMGVIMYDTPNCPRKPCQIETSSANGEGSATHKVTASFETAFEVDKEVAAAVKTALIRLANCATFNKEEFQELLRKISQNPDTGESNQELSEFSSECESESGSELETAFPKDDFSSQYFDCKLPAPERKNRKRLSSERFNTTKLVDKMLERLRCLQEDELSSLATIVATCGLNAALAEVQNSKPPNPALNFPRRISSVGAGNLEASLNGHSRRQQIESELPSLDKFLVKHTTKLEREVSEAKNSRKNESGEGAEKNSDRSAVGEACLDDVTSSKTNSEFGSDFLIKRTSKLEKELEEAKKKSGRDFETDCKRLYHNRTLSEAVPDLGTILIKHSSKLEKEIEEAKRKSGKKTIEMNGEKLGGVKKNGFVDQAKEDVPELPSLDKFLVKRVSRLEKEVQEAKNRRNESRVWRASSMKTKIDSSASDAQPDKIAYPDEGIEEKENIDLNSNLSTATAKSSLQIGQMKIENKEAEDSLENILIKPLHRLEREKLEALSLKNESNYGSRYHKKKQAGNNATDCESLDKILVKHVSRLEKEKMKSNSRDDVVNVKSSETKVQCQSNQEGGLDQILVKHKSRLEREKLGTAAQQPEDQIRSSAARREAREKELQEAWGGLSLGNSMKPHLSKLQRDKAAWIKAEEEERRMPIKDM